MAFQNELIPPLAQETSAFLKHAQHVVRALTPRRRQWTVDRDRELALVKHGLKHEIEDAETCLWSFIDRKGCYTFTTETVSAIKLSSDVVTITQRLKGFRAGEHYSQPDSDTLAWIKEALQEYKDYGVFSDFKQCRLTLIDVPQDNSSSFGRLVHKLFSRGSDA